MSITLVRASRSNINAPSTASSRSTACGGNLPNCCAISVLADDLLVIFRLAKNDSVVTDGRSLSAIRVNIVFFVYSLKFSVSDFLTVYYKKGCEVKKRIGLKRNC